MNTPAKITIIGTGKVAQALAAGFLKSGHVIHEVYGRNAEKAQEFAERFGSKAVTHLQELDETADFYILALSDDAIESVASQLQLTHGVLIHTSGAMALEVLSQKQSISGVFYPLYSFWGQEVDFADVPICVEGTDGDVSEKLLALAQSLGSKATVLSSDERLKLHLAAVFSNNFTNFLWVLMENYLKTQHIDFNLLLPLIRQSARKMEMFSAAESQTGPARRGDRKTIEKHLEILKSNEELSSFYRTFTQSIDEFYHNENK